MTSRRDWFVDYYKACPGESYVEIADGKQLEVAGEGDVEVQLPSGKVILQGALHIPGLRKNLLSTSWAADSGVEATFTKTRVSLRKEGKEIAVGRRVGNLYVLNAAKRRTAKPKEEVPDPELWHRRMGHAGRDAIASLIEKEAATGIRANRASQDICGDCQQGKQTRRPFSAAGGIRSATPWPAFT
jgi:hypothetical protein